MEDVLLYTREKWNQLTGFSKKEALKEKLWNDIVDRYSEPYRFYHNLNHVASLFKWSEEFLPHLHTPAVVGFSILYHNVFYDTFKDDSEELSAAIAIDHLQQLQVNKKIIRAVEETILATKTHASDGSDASPDLSFFLDFDLAILGTGWDEYEVYSHQIRKEYRQYPDAVYQPGRKHALEQLSTKEHLYFTPFFRDSVEPLARKNIFREIQLL